MLKIILFQSYYLDLKFNCFNNPIPRFQIVATDESQVYHCNVCNRFISGLSNNLMNHMKGKSHKKMIKRLAKCVIVTRLPERKPILGLEYIVELANGPMNQLFYVCFLCRSEENERNILNHLNSCKHTQKYLVSFTGC